MPMPPDPPADGAGRGRWREVLVLAALAAGAAVVILFGDQGGPGAGPASSTTVRPSEPAHFTTTSAPLGP